MKILAGHRVGKYKTTADLQFFRGKTLADDYAIYIRYTCPALDWSVWVEKTLEINEKREVIENFDFLVFNVLNLEKHLSIRIESILLETDGNPLS